MSSTRTVLITGANRGIGRGLAEAFLQQENTTVLACVRDPSNASSKSLAEHKPAAGSSIHLVELDVTNRAHYSALRSKFADLNINALDIVIANAGIFATFTTVFDTDAEDFKRHFEINTVGPLLLFQATRDFILRSDKGRFVAISAASSSITHLEQIPIPATSHGSSKAALNWLVRKIHFENAGLISFSMDPGFVQTDLSDIGVEKLGLKTPGMPVEESAQAMLKVIEHASRDETSGTFMQYNGRRWRW